MTQFELAVKSGVSLSTVTNVEAGRQEPGLGAAQKIAAAFGVLVDDIDWLNTGDGPKAEATVA